ncbi:MAG: hypothetical protein B7Y56_08785 [Gallionellales bacterium 35-53-114]|jgi:ABC-type uncharacterized transport system substrate-binding protein|nr:MAG: hypothetical protein B7Y56_08785 [Gallionellales bacterium 35-53-114]OYZ62720.1 MAG: hypothetical protein B7Y04_12640 [Gallionellales bacterium 24-53-125]OZB09796.1 MAG: hypothetical protein B7X61_04540 [Gallionellales bacterium 39-52-133]
MVAFSTPKENPRHTSKYGKIRPPIWGNIPLLICQVFAMRGRSLSILVFLVLHGCAQPPQDAKPMPANEQVATSASPPRKAPSPMQVVILASEDIPAYSTVANAIARQLGKRASIHYLTGSQLENIKAVAKLKNEENTQIVSVGLNASIAAKSLGNKQVIFCQVYNHQDYGLLTPRRKGVSMLPSIPKTFSAWRSLSPSVTDIGVISGPGFDDVIQTARISAKSHGFRLHHKTVNSDKEYQYAYKNMSKMVQAYWLLPDNRVLSEHILRDVMTFSVRNSKQVAVFSDELLKLGGLFSVSSDYHDIANQVIERLEQAGVTDIVPGPDIAYLDKLKLRINVVMAKNLGVEIPEPFRKFAHAP